jgi:hypothetical protein
MASNKDLLNEMKKLAGLQLNEFTIAEAPKKSAAPADDGRQYYRDPGDGGPVVPLGTKSQAGAGLYGDEKGRFDKMPGDNTRFFSTPGPETAKPAPVAPAPAAKAPVVTKDQLDKFRQDTGNPNATLGQYMNQQKGLTARKGGANDPDMIQKNLAPDQQAYRPGAAPAAPAPVRTIPSPTAPGGQFAPGSRMGTTPAAPTSPLTIPPNTGPKSRFGDPTQDPGTGKPIASPTPPPAAPAPTEPTGGFNSARGGTGPTSIPSGEAPAAPAAPAPKANAYDWGGGSSDGPAPKMKNPPSNPVSVPQTGSDDYALGGGKDVYRPLLNPDRTIDAIKPSVPNFMKPLPSAPFDKNSTGGAPNMGGTPSAPVKPNNDPPTLRNPVAVTPNQPVDTIVGMKPGGASDIGSFVGVADDPAYPGYKDRQDAADFKRPFQKLKSYFDSDQHMGKDVVTDSEEPMDEAEPTFFDRVDNQNPLDAAIDRLKRLGGITGYQKDQPSAAPKKTDGPSDRDREQMNNLVGSVAADKPNSFKPGPPSDKPNNFEKRSDESIETMAWLAGLR